jgi:Ran GTPase-activating protein (RanGAP) involved in mRNA processing and transport
MIIRDEKSSSFDFSNYSLLNKSALAVAEAIKVYALPVETINLMNNGLRTKDCIMFIDSFEKHYQKLEVLNLSKNKMGLKGAIHLAKAV